MQDRVTNSLDVSSRSFARPNDTQNTATPGNPSQTVAIHGLRKKQTFLGRCYPILFAAAVLTTACCWFVTSMSAGQAASPDNILLDFSATWCGPCQQMSSIVSKLERENLPIRKVDIDAEAALARQYKVSSIPCFVLIANGQEINRKVGATDEKTLRSMMMMLPKPKTDDGALAKAPRTGGMLIPTTNPNPSNSGDRRLFPRIPPLFAKNADAKLTPTGSVDTVRGQNPSLEATSDEFARDPLTASIRIKVKDASRVHYGSGTIIESQPGRSIILTCGHIFRDLGKDAVVEVDFFPNAKAKPQTVVGQVVKFDLKSDLGLLEVPTPVQLMPAKLRAPADVPSINDRVSSVGCGGGERPSVQDHSVTAINRYNGPDNIECTGVPQQGRSGGGLFLGSELIGVLFGADPKDKRGLYTSMKPVAQFLTKAKFGYLIPSNPANEPALADAEPLTPTGPALNSTPSLDDEIARREDEEVASLIAEATRGAGSGSAAASDYLGAEVVCIVRPKTPGATSRVVIINQATSRFVDDLLHESGGTNRNATVSNQRGSRDPRNSKQPAAIVAKPESRMAMQKPNIRQTKSDEPDQPIETSYEPQRYRRKASSDR